MRSTNKFLFQLTQSVSILILVMGFGRVTYAQDCNSPITLCAETPPTAFEPAGNPINFGCFNADNTSYFQFTSNSSSSPGIATITLDTWECDTVPTDVFLVVVEFGVDPCDVGSYSIVGNCDTGVIPFSFNTPNLSPDTDYLLIVGSNTDTSINSCDAELSISGPAVDINACCDGEISLGDSYEITVSGGTNPIGPPDFDYQWGPPQAVPFLDDANTDNPTATPEETTTFGVTASVGDCLVSDNVTVIVGPPISIPNMITPNGDLINDLWIIGGISRFEAAAVTVYDRWGQIVFNTIGYTQPWDGTNEGTALKSATYYYVIELNSTDVATEPITGSITLIH